jgi:HEAT repeat protein
MLSINAWGGFPRIDKKTDIDQKANKLQQPGHLFTGYVPVEAAPHTAAARPSIFPAGNGVIHPLTVWHADALRVLTFAGKNQQVELEKKFLHTLKHTEDPVEKATVADILGRVKSVAAKSHLLKLLDEKEHVQVRTSAAQALASIGSGSHEDGYTAPQLSEALWDTYRQRTEALRKEIEQASQDLSYEEKMAQDEAHEDRFQEIKALVHGVSRLNVVRHNEKLVAELRHMLGVSQEKEATVQELSHQKDMADAEFYNVLKGKYRRPVNDILKEIPAEQLKDMKRQIQVVAPDGISMNLLEVGEQLNQLKRQQEKFDLRIVTSLMEALSLHDNREANTALKGGLDCDHHEIRARSLKMLAGRNRLNYSSDVYPNLSARHSKIRQAALTALLDSPEPAAKQKAVELITPGEFFKLAGGLNADTLGQYRDFLSEMAERGDEYVEALSSKVMNPDYGLDFRQIGLHLLGMVAREPIAHRVSSETVAHAAMTLKLATMAAPGKNATERAAIATTAMVQWVQTKDFAAIPAAIMLAETREHKISGRDQERLLSAVVRALSDDRDERSRATRTNRLAGNVLDILQAGESNLLTDHLATELRANIKPDRLQKQLRPESPDAFAEAIEGVERDPVVADKLKPALEALRPALIRLGESDKSKTAQMLAFRVMGLLQDKDAVPYLINRVNNPLKGQMDWKAELSYWGDPAIDGLRLRFNALKALGDIGDARALKVFTPLLEDANLRRIIPEPLSRLASDANQHASKAELNVLRRKLAKLMADPDTSRGMRAVRLRAANALYQFKDGLDTLKAFVANTRDPNFRRHALSALVSNNHGLEPEHPDHHLVKSLLNPELGVERLHARGITGKGVDMAIVDGGFVDDANREGFQQRVKLPASWDGDPESEHPTMVMSTAAANGKLKGVAPDVRVFSDRWPEFDSADPMEVYKKIIEGKMRGENNVRVINNSWGFSNQNILLHQDVRDILKKFKSVVDMAEKAGIQIVFAAGNEGEEPSFPTLGTMTLFGLDVDKLTDDQKRNYNAILDKVITVGATNTQGSEKRAEHRMAEFSSVGDSSRSNKMKPTIVAPGVDMMVYGWDKALGKGEGNPKRLVNGTSFASPYVSGVLSLMAQVNDQLTPKEMREILKKAAVKLPGVPVSHQGFGEINPEAAVKLAEKYQHNNGNTRANAASSSPALGSDDEDVEMVDAAGSVQANDRHDHQPSQSKVRHQSSPDILKGLQTELHTELHKVAAGRVKRQRRSSEEARVVRGGRHNSASFAGASSTRQTGYTESAFNWLTGFRSGQTTPSRASRLDFNHGPASALRMNPPKEPVLDITR